MLLVVAPEPFCSDLVEKRFESSIYYDHNDITGSFSKMSDRCSKYELVFCRKFYPALDEHIIGYFVPSIESSNIIVNSIGYDRNKVSQLIDLLKQDAYLHNKPCYLTESQLKNAGSANFKKSKISGSKSSLGELNYTDLFLLGGRYLKIVDIATVQQSFPDDKPGIDFVGIVFIDDDDHLNFWVNDPTDAGLMFHEINHVIDYCYDYIGVDNYDTEIHSYAMQFLYYKIMEIYYEKNIIV